MADLRYSDRALLAEQGSLGPISYEAPEAFRRAIGGVFEELSERRPAGILAYMAAKRHMAQHFESYYEALSIGSWLTSSNTSTADVLDAIEILIEEAATQLYGPMGGASAPAWGDIARRVNRLFLRYRFGYTLDANANVRRVGSPALDETIVAPALFALQRPGWEQADRSFRQAIHHQRGGPDERDDALTAATAALEAALKAAGLDGDRLSSLAKSLRNSGLVPGQLQGVPEALDTLLKRSGAIRDPFSDAHGKAPDAPEVPAELVDLSIYWTGAFVNYLAATTSGE